MSAFSLLAVSEKLQNVVVQAACLALCSELLGKLSKLQLPTSCLSVLSALWSQDSSKYELKRRMSGCICSKPQIFKICWTTRQVCLFLWLFWSREGSKYLWLRLYVWLFLLKISKCSKSIMHKVHGCLYPRVSIVTKAQNTTGWDDVWPLLLKSLKRFKL